MTDSMFYTTPRFSIFFGDQATNFAVDEFDDIASATALKNAAQFKHVAEQLQLTSLMVLKQVHGIAGKVFTKPEDFALQPYAVEGDYLITSVPDAGLGIATADCLPIIIYDPVHHVVAALHAGWRGSVVGIAGTVLEEMAAVFGTKPEDCQVIFGPSGRACCYEVDEKFLGNITLEYRERVIIKRDGRLFFDNMLYNQLLLQKLGVPEVQFLHTYAQCTICSPQFCSYRRDNKQAKRQMTIAVLNPI